MKTYRSYSSEETKLIGARLARLTLRPVRRAHGRQGFRLSPTECLQDECALIPRQARDKCSLIFALKGDLGSGKTTFTQGFLRGLGVRARVNSPTFVLMKRFRLKNKRFKNVYHLDCYRVKRPKELLSLGLKGIFDDPKNLVLIEWPERISKILPRGILRIAFRHGKKESERLILSNGLI